MYLYARFLGYKGSITDCDLWAKKEFKKRNFNTILEIEIDFYASRYIKAQRSYRSWSGKNKIWELLVYLCFRKN